MKQNKQEYIKITHKKTCLYCQKEYYGKTEKSKYCSKNCRAKERYYNKRDFKVTRKECEICGKIFIPDKFHAKSQLYCSKKCNQKNKRLQGWYIDYQKEYQKRWKLNNPDYWKRSVL